MSDELPLPAVCASEDAPAEAPAAEPVPAAPPELLPPPPPEPPARWQLAFRWLLLPVIGVLLLVGYMPIRRSAQAMTFPYSLDREEGFLMEQAICLTRGQTIYPDLKDYPYTVGNYTPVYPALYAGLLGILGRPSLPAGRGLVLLATLAIAASIARLILRDTDCATAGLLGAGLFLASWDLNNWIAFARVDLPAIAFSLAGLAVLCTSKGRLAVVWAALLMALAFHTKQTQVIVPAAAGGALLVLRDWKRFALFVTVWLAAAGCGGLVLNAVTGGEFIRHTVIYNANVFDVGQMKIWFRHLWRIQMFLIIASVAATALLAVLLWRGWQREDGGASAPALTFLAVLFYLGGGVAGVAGAGKIGAAANYMLDFQAAAALMVGLAAGRFITMKPRALPALAGAAVATVLLLILASHAWRLGRLSRFTDRPIFEGAPTPQLAELMGRIDVEVRDCDGPVLSEDPAFLILAGKDVIYQPFIMSQLAKEGKWDETPFVADLASGRFELLITMQDIRDEKLPLAGFTPAMAAAIRANYEFDRQVWGYYLWRVRGAAKPRSTIRTMHAEHPEVVPTEPGVHARHFL